MTAPQELQSFASTLEPFCQANNLKCVCLKTEDDLLLGMRVELKPYLYLTQVSEQFVSGHVLPVSGGRNFFILVRTPFAASATLKIVTLRTYSLIIAQARDMRINRFERDLSPPAPQKDLWELLALATDAVVQAIAADQAFIQPVESVPFPTKKPELVAYRAAFFTGTVAGTVLSSTGEEPEKAGAPAPVQLYVL
ncbi:MAG: hypothetical protein HZA90_20060 [Verrucomicrobia bacterium]|nr:hypothetical protein [Verrucomicrobiota bacterium]